ncbi:hypothetical protein [Rhizobium ruizarguesonis]|uniref:hypothetical protein n=1 Tax=Rhizobium ruizarguesonis TaxID=2081791 RepID=UPI00103123A0|nr:hypothetical protein [Rhizobium ruizarguesonis]TBE06171.1 hypothetical protein ELH12_09165 [Rhizobium ruizarguesonis]TBE77529.1 hypothetical protein ELH01_10095 [Rhizobium ruizarguesonis]TBE87009.1 hypothetical protein ELG99_09165 [Rhizobium ruizarguesonis]
MNDDSARPARDIHLLTTNGVLADLVGGREVLIRGSDPYSLDGARSVLEWYRANSNRWAVNQNAADIDAVDAAPHAVAADAAPAPVGVRCRLTLKRKSAGILVKKLFAS